MFVIAIVLLAGSACGVAAFAGLLAGADAAAAFDIQPDERLLATLAVDD